MKMHYIATVLGNNELQLQRNMCLSESAPPCSREGPGPHSCSVIWAESAPAGGWGTNGFDVQLQTQTFSPGACALQVHGTHFHRAGQP